MIEATRSEAAALRVVITKSERRLVLLRGEEVVMTVPIVLGREPVGQKGREGDGRTPEGEFFIFARNPESKYHRSLAISYPDPSAVERAYREGAIDDGEYREARDAIARGEVPRQNTAMGGEIYIHGGGIDGDWTQGCIAIADDAIEELFEAAEVGIRVTIKP